MNHRFIPLTLVIPSESRDLLMKSREIRIGVDLGGTKIEAIALASDGAILARERIPTPRNYDDTVRAITELVARIEHAAGVSGSPVGIGIPGAVTPATGL